MLVTIYRFWTCRLQLKKTTKNHSAVSAHTFMLNMFVFLSLLFSFSEQTSGAAGYSKFVSREMSKAEALLKVSNQMMFLVKDVNLNNQ